MAKFYSLAFVSLLLLALGSCQSLEQISIDYMQPGDMTFPSQLRKVAIVNNTSTEPDNKLITQTEKPKENVPEISHATAYANGNVKIAAESLAEEIAHQNYFDVVVICDSALRANDKFPREKYIESGGSPTADIRLGSGLYHRNGKPAIQSDQNGSLYP